MMSNALVQMRDLIQQDVGERGLQTVPGNNLVTACPDDFSSACRSIAATDKAAVGIVTGFLIAKANPPAAETDGPLGAIFLARALIPLGIRVVLMSDEFCQGALTAGLNACGLSGDVSLIILGPDNGQYSISQIEDLKLTHLLALERPGPSHTVASITAQCSDFDDAAGVLADFQAIVPAAEHDRYHNQSGMDITKFHGPAHVLFERAKLLNRAVVTIGIGDGGNEIGMGKIPWRVIQQNIPNGGLIACRVPVDHLIVSGVSNWGAYGLAAGVRLLRGEMPRDLFSINREEELLRIMVEEGPLVDGVLAKKSVSVDGIPLRQYLQILENLASIR